MNELAQLQPERESTDHYLNPLDLVWINTIDSLVQLSLDETDVGLWRRERLIMDENEG